MAILNLKAKFETEGQAKVVKEANKVEKAIAKAANTFDSIAAKSKKTSKTVKASVTQMTGSTNAFRSSVKSLEARGKQLGVSTKSLTNEFRKFSAAAGRGNISTTALARRSQILRAALAATKLEMAEVSSKAKLMSRAMTTTSKSTNTLVDKLDRATKSMRLMEGPLGGIAGRMTTLSTILKSGSLFWIGLAVAIAAVGFALFKTITALFRFEVEFSRLRARFRVVTGSAQAASTELSILAATSKRLGLDFKPTAIGFSTFAVSAKLAGLKAEETSRIFLGLATAASALSLSGADVNGILRAFTQILSKGTVQSEELKGQIGERLPGAFNLAAKAMGLTTQQLGKMLEKGEILAIDLLPRLADELFKTFEQQANIDNLAKATARFSTSIDNLFNTLTTGSIGNFFTSLTNALSNAADAVNDALVRLQRGSTTTIFTALKEAFSTKLPRGFISEGVIGVSVPINQPKGPLTTGEAAKLEKDRLIETFKGIDERIQARKSVSNISAISPFRDDGLTFRQRQQKAIDFREQERIRAGVSKPALPPLDNVVPIDVEARSVVVSRAGALRDENDALAATEKLETARITLFKDEQKQLSELTKTTDTFNFEMDRLNILSAKYPEFADQIRQKQMQLTNTFIQTQPVLRGLSNAFDTFGEGILDVMTNSGNAIKSFSDVAKAVLNSLLKDFVRFTVLNPLKQGIFGGSEGLFSGFASGSILGGLLGGGGGASASLTTAAPGRLFAPGAAFADGGSFKVGGTGGADTQSVSFRATPGERVDILTPSQQKSSKKGGDTFIIDARGADPGQLRRLEDVIRQLDGSIERRAVSATSSARNRILRGGA